MYYKENENVYAKMTPKEREEFWNKEAERQLAIDAYLEEQNNNPCCWCGDKNCEEKNNC